MKFKSLSLALISLLLVACDTAEQKTEVSVPETIRTNSSSASTTSNPVYELDANGGLVIKGYEGAYDPSQSDDIERHAAMTSSAIWIEKEINVCWENPEEKFQEDMDLVRKAVSEQWEKNSALEFSFWGKCVDQSKGIRILIDDSGAHTKGLGKRLDGVKNGMVLNLEFNNWFVDCKKNAERKKQCVYYIGVHEFGHAIGFTHEHIRSDTPPGECQRSAGGSVGDLHLTPWDPKSVMNYCDPDYSVDGNLSEHDIFAVNSVYGEN